MIRTLALFFMCLVVCITASAQTNILTFTNNSGVVYSNVTVVKVEPDGILFRNSEGLVYGREKYTNMSESLQTKFGYDPIKAAEYEQKQKELRAKQAVQQATANKAAADAQASEKRRKIIDASKMVVTGKLIQKLDNGLLVESGSERERRTITRVMHMPGRMVRLYDPKTELQIYDGLCLLTDYPDQAKVVDDDVVHAIAYPNGEYSYTTVNESSKTIRKFTCNLNAVSEMADDIQQKALRAPRPQ